MKVKIEVFIESSDIEAIEKLAKAEGVSRSNWIRDAVESKLEIDVARYEYDVAKLIELLEQYSYSSIPIKELIEMAEKTPGVIRIP